MTRFHRKRKRPALWLKADAVFQASIAPPVPPPSPLQLAREAWETYHAAGDFMPRWWNDIGEREDRFRAAHPHLFAVEVAA